MKLETRRLILRKPKISDWRDIIEGTQEFDVAKMTENIPHPYKKKNALDWLKSSIKKWEKEEYVFLIELKKEKKVIGCIHLMNIKNFSGTATTGSWINKKYWRKGYITEAKIAVNNFAFNKLKLRKLNSTVMTNNKASNRTQQSVGYKKEGLQIKQARALSTGKLRDIVLYGLFKEDWKKNLPRLKKKLNEKIKKLEKN